MNVERLAELNLAGFLFMLLYGIVKGTKYNENYETYI